MANAAALQCRFAEGTARSRAPHARLAVRATAVTLWFMVLTVTECGLYCAAGDFHIDPWRPVPRALITHGHSDHARPGSGAYLSTDAAAPVIRHRLGDIRLETVPYGEALRIGGVTASFHPAGHVPGSAQIRVEKGGEVWVVSGDYKTEDDGLSTPFEPVRCHSFVTECTFGLPVFRWAPQAEIAAQINAWWRGNAAEGRTSVLGAYTLGKAQRLLSLLEPEIGAILTHGAVENVNAVIRAQGLALPPTTLVTPDLAVREMRSALVVCPPSAIGTSWMRRFGEIRTAFASGWMQLRGVRRRRAADRGFVLSDHADWPGLNDAIRATGAEHVLVTHGYTAVFRDWLESCGYRSEIVATEFEGERIDDNDGSGASADIDGAAT